MNRIAQDIIFVAIGIGLSIIFVRFHAVDLLIDMVGNTMIASFIVGIFFTSLFTIAPAAVLLVDLALVGHPITIALFGALGAVVGDMILFIFVRDRLSEDIISFVKNGFKKIHFHQLHSKMFKRSRR